MLITHYTDYEGGPWHTWTAGEISKWRRVRRGEVAIQPKDFHSLPYMVHALRFENGDEWDAINGARDMKWMRACGAEFDSANL